MNIVIVIKELSSCSVFENMLSCSENYLPPHESISLNPGRFY